MKIKFPRRVKFTREIAVGLVVLLLLTVVLSVVAARRIMRRDAAIAMEDERFPERQDDHRDKDLEARRDAFPPPLPVPVSESVREREKDKLREAPAMEHRQEKREEKIEHAVAQGFATTDAPKPPAVAKVERHEEAKHLRKADELPMPPSLDSDERYGAAPAATTLMGPRDRAEAGKAKPLVIQVSGDSPDGPSRRMDGQMSERRPDARRPELARPGDAFAGRGQATPIAEEDREHRGLHPIEPHSEMSLVTPAYPARDPRHGYDAAASVPMENVKPGYPGPAGYAGEGAMRRDEPPRREEFQRPFAENPLRSDGLYEVQPNDSFWTISQRVYGTGAYFAPWWRSIAARRRGPTAFSRDC